MVQNSELVIAGDDRRIEHLVLGAELLAHLWVAGTCSTSVEYRLLNVKPMLLSMQVARVWTKHSTKLLTILLHTHD